MAILKVDTITSADTPTVSITDGASISGVTTFSSDINIADKIVHTGDTNTAIRFPAADTVSVETAGSERLRIDSAGRIGIGEVSPGSYSSGAYNLVISAPSGSNSGITINSASGGTDSGAIFFSHGTASGANGVGRIRYYHSDDHMDFYTANAERLRIANNGSVSYTHLTLPTKRIV